MANARRATKSSSQKKRIIFIKRETVEQIQTSTFNRTIREIASKGEKAILDFTEIRTINSSSLHYLHKVIHEFRPKIEITGIPVLFVEMLNATSDFFPKEVKILSFFAPFTDSTTDAPQERLLRVGEDVPILANYKDFDPMRLIPEGSALEPDFEPEHYFTFLTSYSEPASSETL